MGLESLSDNLPDLEAKFDRLLARFGELGRVLVAYSGGVDSTLALKVGTLALGDNCIGVTARSESLADEDLELTLRVAREHGLRQEIIEYSELGIEHYAANPVNRCYFCKHELYSRLQGLARRFGVTAIVDGTNADDAGDYRPGSLAAEELQVLSPLKEIGLGKAEIRALARRLGLPNWDKPAAACLSSRVPYGEPITAEKLRQIGEAEAFLRGLGFAQVRVRHHDRIARLEVAPEDIARLAAPETRGLVLDRLRALGFQFVTVDLAGYRTGSLNEMLAGAIRRL